MREKGQSSPRSLPESFLCVITPAVSVMTQVYSHGTEHLRGSSSGKIPLGSNQVFAEQGPLRAILLLLAEEALLNDC